MIATSRMLTGAGSIGITTAVLVKTIHSERAFTLGALVPSTLTLEVPVDIGSTIKIMLFDRPVNKPPKLVRQSAVPLSLERIYAFYDDETSDPTQMACPCDRHAPPTSRRAVNDKLVEGGTSPKPQHQSSEAKPLSPLKLTTGLWHFCANSAFLFLLYEKSIGVIISVDLIEESSHEWRIDIHTCLDGIRLSQPVLQAGSLGGAEALAPDTIEGVPIQVATVPRGAEPYEWLFMNEENPSPDGRALITPLVKPVEELVMLMETDRGFELLRLPVCMLVNCRREITDRPDLLGTTSCHIRTGQPELLGFLLPSLESHSGGKGLIAYFFGNTAIESHKLPTAWMPKELPEILSNVLVEKRKINDALSTTLKNEGYLKLAGRLAKSLGNSVLEATGLGSLSTTYLGSHDMDVTDRVKYGFAIGSFGFIIGDEKSGRFHLFMTAMIPSRGSKSKNSYVPVLHGIHSTWGTYRRCNVTFSTSDNVERLIIHQPRRGSVEVWTRNNSGGFKLDQSRSQLMGEGGNKLDTIIISPKLDIDLGLSSNTSEHIVVVGPNRESKDDLQMILTNSL